MIASLLHNGWMVFLLVIFFGVTIFIHELGHFIVARWCGMVVDTFAVGFGPAIWKRKIGDITYKIGCIPFGGYVALPQLDPSGMKHVQGSADGEGQRELPRIEPWKKILVSVAGAAGNILLAFALAWVVYLVGMPAGPEERSTVIGFVDPDSQAYAEGLRIGDRIVSINGTSVRNWSDVRLELALHHDVELVLANAEGATRSVRMTTEKGILGEQTVLGIDGPNLCMVMSVDPRMSAAKAGIQSGDLITALGGEPLHSREHLVYLVAKNENAEIPLTVERLEGEKVSTFMALVRPEMDKERKQVRIGITFNLAAREQNVTVHPLPTEQVRSHATAIFRFLKALTTPKQTKAATGAVGGPVAIVASYWLIVKTSIMLAIWFTGFLNVNLAIINLLPIPVLDGGHVCFSLWEWVTGRPLSPRIVNALVNGFAMLLIGVFVLLTFRDVGRFTPIRHYWNQWVGDSAEPTNAPALPGK